MELHCSFAGEIEETEAAINYEEYYISRGQNYFSTAQIISQAVCFVALDLAVLVKCLLFIHIPPYVHVIPAKYLVWQESKADR